MKNTALTILLFLLTLNPLNAQKIESRFQGGQEAFGSFVARNIKYPNNSVIGTSVAGITIDKVGNIKEIEILNSLSDQIDREVIRVIKETQPFWLPNENDNDVTFILPITFSTNTIPTKHDEFICDNLLEELEFVIYGSNDPDND